MDKLLYEILLGFIYFMFVTSLILVPFSVVKLAKRKKNGIYIIKIFLFYGWFCLIFFYIIFVDALLIDGLNYQSKNILGLMIMMLLYAAQGIVLSWMCSHYGIIVEEDKLIHNKLFFGKCRIEFNEIDIQNSTYLFVHPKGKRSLGHNVMELQMKNGDKHFFRREPLLQENDSLMLDIAFKLKIKRQSFYKRNNYRT